MTQLNTEVQTPVDAPISAECHACGELFPVRRLQEHEGHMFCVSCLEEKGLVRCSACATWVHSDNSLTTYDDDIICHDCYSEDYFTCAHCDNIRHNNDGISTSHDEMICQRCYDRYYFSCPGCGDVLRSDHAYSTDSGESYCETCFNDRSEECSNCGDEYPADELTHVRGQGNLCPHCMPNSPIHNYSYKPVPIFFGEHGVLSDEQAVGKTFLGIELEVHCDNITGSLNTIEETDRERLYCKEDGSVHHGFEIVSHPMTIAGHRSFDWVAFCDKMVASGAHGNRLNHGIHIHITKTYLSELTRLRMSWFMCHHFKEVVKLARRDTVYCQSRSPEEIIYTIKTEKRYAWGRSEILNWGPTNTVEYRLPLSSLRGETVLATLEFCDAAVRFVQEDHGFMLLRDCWNVFMTWCAENNYKALVGYYLSEEWGDSMEEK
jgi:hypothetical protein